MSLQPGRVGLVSVVVPSHGGARRLPRLVADLAAQSYPNLEVIVVLDGDVDGSAAALDAAALDAAALDAAALDAAPVAVRRVVLPENRGRPAALNAGFAAARGDILIRCDDDLAVRPDWAAEHAAAHSRAAEQGRRVGVVGFCRNVFPPSPYARAYGEPASRSARAAAYTIASEQAWRLWGANVSVTRETYERVGEYATAFRTYGWEDVDWGYRLHAAGVPVELVGAVEVDHLGAAPDTVSRSRRALHAGSARRTFEQRHGIDAYGPLRRPGGPWGVAVRGTARLLTESRLGRLARAVDGILPGLPPTVGEKLVALLVESAGIAGYDRPDADRVSV